MEAQLHKIENKCLAGERITPAEALALYHHAPLWLLSRLATERRRGLNGNMLFYNRNFHLEPTNICKFNCSFCSYRKGAGSDEAWDHSIAEMLDIVRAREQSGATEVHIVGGVHPDHGLEFYLELIAGVKALLPQATIKAFTAIELSDMIRGAGLTLEDGLKKLIAAGMGAIPGGGAEIFDEEIRRKICPDKGSTEEWFAVHDAAHRLGVKSNATMLYGHIEGIEQRIMHLDMLREQQDKTGGFNAFIPLKFRSSGNSLSHLGEVSIVEDMRMLALSRLMLDNIPHLKAYWVMYGKSTTEMALSFGADDVDGTIEDSTKIYSMAGAEDRRPTITIAEIEQMAARAGLEAAERDTNYNII
ncbi:MAG: CofH family radical SAM protein [Rikenellaceae bacterium]